MKAIACTMTGQTEKDKTTNAGQNSTERVECMGKYNPLKTRPVKVKFSGQIIFKNRKKLPKGIFIDKKYSKSTEKEC